MNDDWEVFDWLGDPEDYATLKEVDRAVLTTVFDDARKEWRVKKKPLLRWLVERVEHYKRHEEVGVTAIG